MRQNRINYSNLNILQRECDRVNNISLCDHDHAIICFFYYVQVGTHNISYTQNLLN